MKKLALVIMLITFTGCSFAPLVFETGAPVKKEDINDKNIKPGLTTKENIIMIFGEPFKVENIGGYDEKLIYMHQVTTKKRTIVLGKEFTSDEKAKKKVQLFEVFIEKGFVSKYNYSYIEE